MGAWGEGILANDDALDWLHDVDEGEPAELVPLALRAVTEAKAYLEAPEASVGLAASEVVAAGRGHPVADPNNELADRVAARWPDAAQHAELAAAAARRVLDDGSELRELWKEAGDEDFAAWRATVDDLIARLSRSRSRPPG